MQICSISVSSFPSAPQLFRVRHGNSLGFPKVTCNEKEILGGGSKNNNRTMFLLGFGYVAQFFAKELIKDGNWKVLGTCTSTTKKKKLEEMGLGVQVFNSSDNEVSCLNSLTDATHLLVSIPPITSGDQVLDRHWNLLQSKLCNENLQWLCYLSSTGVYGDCGGAWADEDYLTKPMSDSGKARLVAEKQWLNLGHDLGVSVQLFRLGGIYGPGRSALDTILKQRSLTDSQRLRGARQYTSRVHVADICEALRASIRKPSSGRIYNIVDDDPASRAEVFAFAHTLIEKKWPGQIKTRNYSDMSGSNNQAQVLPGQKRVSNARLKNELGVQLFHPTYRSGLESIIKSMENPFH